MARQSNYKAPDVTEVLRDCSRVLGEAADLALILASAIPDEFTNSAVPPGQIDAARIASLEAMDSFLASFGSIKAAREKLLVGSRHLSAMRRGLGVPILECLDGQAD